MSGCEPASTVAYRDFCLVNFTEAPCWEECCMLNGIHMQSHSFTCNRIRSHAIACVHIFAVCRLEVDKALAGLRNRILG